MFPFLRICAFDDATGRIAWSVPPRTAARRSVFLGPSGRAVLVLLLTLAAMSLAPRPAAATALYGPITGGEMFPNGWFQTPATEFRWSPITGAVKVQFDTTFIDAFGLAGKFAFENAMQTWQTPKIAAGRNFINPAPAGRFDLESVAAHELGHAIGLHHDDEAAAFGKNFTPLMASPFLGAGGAPAPAASVMHSTLGKGVTLRDLTLDDWAGVKFLYDPANVNLPVAPEMVALGGLGSITLMTNGVDGGNVDLAILGASLGQNIDVFAKDFSQPGALPAEGQTDINGPDSGGKESIEILRDPNGNPLAYTRARFAYNPGTDGPGIIDGTPDPTGGMNADGMIVAGVDIVFNIEPGLSWHIVPEPSAWWMALASVVAGCCAAARRRPDLLGRRTA